MSVENYLPWAFRLVTLSLVGWTVFCILRKVLRRAGIVAYPPFISRKDYLEAALEMNLEDFIGRAKATPRSLIQKPSKLELDVTPTINQIDRKIQKEISLIDQIRAIKKDMDLVYPLAAPPSDMIGLAGVIGGAIGAAGAIGGGVGVSAPKLSRWFRVKETGELVRACACGMDCSCYQTFMEPLRLILPSSIEAAFPREGEWWQKRLCPKVHQGQYGTSWISGLVEWKYSTNTADKNHGPEIESALCGCLQPVNYGKGNEKSGVA